MEYGSLINYVIGSRSKESFTPNDPSLVPGLACTELCYSDRHPYRVIAVKRDRKGIVKEITVQGLKAIADPRKPHPMGHQNWLVTQDLNSYTATLKWRKSKQGWYAKGYDGKGWTNRFAMGFAEKYYDWSF